MGEYAEYEIEKGLDEWDRGDPDEKEDEWDEKKIPISKEDNRMRQGVSKIFETVVVATCPGCGARREIRPGEIAEGDHPICQPCGKPMIASRVITRRQPAGANQ